MKFKKYINETERLDENILTDLKDIFIEAGLALKAFKDLYTLSKEAIKAIYYIFTTDDNDAEILMKIKNSSSDIIKNEVAGFLKNLGLGDTEELKQYSDLINKILKS